MCIQFSAGRVRSDFEKDKMLSFAVIRALEIFGEAASKVSNEFQKENPNIPWRAIVGTAEKLGFENIYSYQRLETKKCNPTLKLLYQIKKVFPDFSVDLALSS